MTRDYPLQFFDNLKHCHKDFTSKDGDIHIYTLHEHYDFPKKYEIRFEKIDLWETVGTGIYDKYGKEMKVERCVKNLPDNICARCKKEFSPYENCYVNKYIIYGDNRTVIRVYGNHSHICEECAKSYQRVKVFIDDGYVESVNHDGSTQINYCASTSGVNPLYDEDAPKTIDAEILGIKSRKEA